MMRIDELTPELLEKAKKCENYEEKMAFISENEIELTDEQMEALSGGGGKGIGTSRGKSTTCRKCKEGQMVKTGRTKPGKIFGDFWPDEEWRCSCCGFTLWI
ncbi:MAG: hypothetical protein IJJ65_02585 [Butyrivibrio sp.]|nr:hypothetical protein [Butyrivibrio sp.]